MKFLELHYTRIPFFAMVDNIFRRREVTTGNTSQARYPLAAQLIKPLELDYAMTQFINYYE